MLLFLQTRDLDVATNKSRWIKITKREVVGESLRFKGSYVAPSSTLTVLGHCFDSRASTKMAMGYRITQMWKHWHARKVQHCNKRVSVNLRIARFIQTVLGTLLWSSCLRNPTQADCRRVNHEVLEMVRRILGLARGDDETWVAWYIRTCRIARYKLWMHGGDVVARIHLNIHRWSGHAARCPKSSWVYRTLHWRNYSWWRQWLKLWNPLDPFNSLAWKHPTPGAPQRWERRICKSYGKKWHDIAQNRETWKAQEWTYVYERWHESRTKPRSLLQLCDGPRELRIYC